MGHTQDNLSMDDDVVDIQDDGAMGLHSGDDDDDVVLQQGMVQDDERFLELEADRNHTLRPWSWDTVHGSKDHYNVVDSNSPAAEEEGHQQTLDHVVLLMKLEVVDDSVCD